MLFPNIHSVYTILSCMRASMYVFVTYYIIHTITVSINIYCMVCRACAHTISVWLCRCIDKITCYVTSFIRNVIEEQRLFLFLFAFFVSIYLFCFAATPSQTHTLLAFHYSAYFINLSILKFIFGTAYCVCVFIFLIK